MVKFLNNISLEQANDIQFKNAAGTNTGKIEADGNNLVLSNAVGDILLGDGASDVYIGDGTNNVDILFEQSGSIKADDSASGVTLTLGSSNTTLAFGGATSFADVVSAFSGVTANTVDVGTSVKPFRTIYAGHHVGSTSINYATSRGWVEDPAPMDQTQVGEFGGNFTRNGANDENEVVRGLDPFGNKALLWKMILNQPGSNDDGGWNKDIVIPANNNIGYLSYVYFKVDFTADNSNDGTVYLGCGTTSGQTINISNDTSNTNPYFVSNNISTINNGGALIANRWYLIVGVIQPYNDETTGTDTIAGTYDVETGEKVMSGAEYKMGNNTTGQRHRAYVYYDASTDNNENGYFWNPGFHAIDGSEPKLQDLLKRQVYLGDNVKAAFGDSDDLQIYHNGSHSYLDHTGTGAFYIRTKNNSSIYIQDVNGQGIAQFTDGGGCHFYYNNSLKVSTTNTGIDITGEVKGDSLDIDGNADISGNLTGVDTLTALNFVGTSNYHEFGNATGSVSNDGTWNGRLNVAGTSHARLDVKSVSDGIITSMYAHTGNAAGRMGTMSNHPVNFIVNGNVKATLDSSSNFAVTGELEGGSLDINGSADISGTSNFGGVMTINSNVDGKLDLRVTSGDSNDWNYINFTGSDGTRDAFIGTDADGDPQWYRDGDGVYIRLDSSKIYASHMLQVNGELEATSLDINGDANISGTLTLNGLELGAVAERIRNAGDTDSYIDFGGADTINFAFHPAVGAGSVNVYPVPEILKTLPESERLSDPDAETNS